jgi:cardiolipin synthase (CMP-forming)
MNIPNSITLFRLFLIPVFVLVFFSSISHSLIISIVIFGIAGATDILDGYIARKYNLVTKWGTVFDPLADKMMLITALTCLAIYNYAPVWILLVVAGKELLMIVSATFLYRQDIIIPSNSFGKSSTVLFYLSILLLSISLRFGGYLLYAAVLSSVISLGNYVIIFAKSRFLSPNRVE